MSSAEYGISLIVENTHEREKRVIIVVNYVLESGENLNKSKHSPIAML